MVVWHKSAPPPPRRKRHRWLWLWLLFLPWLFVGELPWAIQESRNNFV